VDFQPLNLFTPAYDPEQAPFDGTMPIPVGSYDSLDTLAEDCRRCQRCDLAKSRNKVAVSRGNPDADVLIIGEGPGQQEDLTGLPFVGPAGQMLDRVLASVKLDPETDVFVLNAVKCRPPGNRVPTPEEMAACRPYLVEQIRLSNPKMILVSGGTAAKALLGETRGITKIRGEWVEWEGRPVMPIFHPSYLLRNQSREKGGPKWLMWQDIQEIRRKLDEIQSASGTK
jgi:DNA polymerase